MGQDDCGGHEAWVSRAGRLPCCAWLLVAIASYVALRALTLRPQVIVVDPGGLGPMVAALWPAAILESLQFAVPVVCLSALLAGLLRGKLESDPN